MSNDKKPLNEGYTVTQDGHQPAKKPANNDIITKGYQPTTSHETNPTNTPPKKR